MIKIIVEVHKGPLAMPNVWSGFSNDTMLKLKIVEGLAGVFQLRRCWSLPGCAAISRDTFLSERAGTHAGTALIVRCSGAHTLSTLGKQKQHSNSTRSDSWNTVFSAVALEHQAGFSTVEDEKPMESASRK